MSRPVPLGILLLLLLGLCGLCAWQWNREELLRDLYRRQEAECGGLRKALEENTARAKAGDAEILRLTGALNEIKAASVSKAEHEEAVAATQTMRETVLKQNASLKEQQEALLKSNAAVVQANKAIEKLAAERDGLAQKFNALTLQYNKLVKRLQADAESAAAAPARESEGKPPQ